MKLEEKIAPVPAGAQEKVLQNNILPIDQIRNLSTEKVCGFLYEKCGFKLVPGERCVSPLRAEATNPTSFIIDDNDEGRCSWHDFGAGDENNHGDIINFVMIMEDCGFQEAVAKISNYFGFTVGETIFSPKKLAMLEELTLLAEYAHYSLKKYPEKLQYLQKRGLKDSFIKLQKIGFFDSVNNFHAYLAEEHPEFEPTEIDIFILEETFLFPYFDQDDKIIYAVGRSLPGSDKAKYIKLKCNHPNGETIENPLFGQHTLNNIAYTGRIIFAEGVLDAEVLIQENEAVLASCGGQFSKQQKQDILEVLKNLKEVEGQEIIIWFDHDPNSETGQKSTINFAKFLLQNGYNAKICRFSGDEKIDINDLYVKEGPDAIKEVIAKAELYTSVVMANGDAESKTEIVNDLLEGGFSEEKIIEICNGVFSPEQIKAMSKEHALKLTASPGKKKPDAKHEVLYGPSIELSQTAQYLGKAFGAKSKTVFHHNSMVVKVHNNNGHYSINPMSAQKFRTEFEKVARLIRVTQRGKNLIKEPMHMPRDMADSILACEEFRHGLRELKRVSNCPLPYYDSDGIMDIKSGYNPDTKILSQGEIEDNIPLAQALSLINNILEEYDFKTQADKARVFSLIITPMLELAELLHGRSPLFFIEADASQAGKGLLIRIVAAIYGCKVGTVTEKDRIGSKQESFDAKLMKGDAFISFDNFRGVFNDPAVESFLTEDSYACRILYHSAITIDTRGRIISLTSNGAELTVDMLNRACIIRIRKKPEDHLFKEYPEGNILEHIRANQPKYLGAVYTIVKAYCGNQSQPLRKTRTAGHNFREWAQCLDWIVQNICGQAPLMEGHNEEKQRMSNPNLQWMRSLGLAVIKSGRTEKLYVRELADIAYQHGMAIPGLATGRDFGSVTQEEREQVWKQFGRRLSAAFCGKSEISVDHLRILIAEGKERRNAGKLRDVKKYQFADSSADEPQIGTQIAPPQAADAVDNSENFSMDELSNETDSDINRSIKIIETSAASKASAAAGPKAALKAAEEARLAASLKATEDAQTMNSSESGKFYLNLLD